MNNKILTKDENLFIKNFNLILSNSQIIIDTPEFYACRPKFIRMSNPYGAPQNNMGNLCLLWKAGKFIDQCIKCGGTRYIVGGSGNLGGGISDNTGICRNCKNFATKSRHGERPSHYIPLLSATLDFRRKQIFKQYWHIAPISLAELVTELKKNPN